MLTKACQIAVEQGGFQMAWVGMHDPVVNKVLPVTSAGVVDGYLDLINVDLNDKARSCGPTARSFLSGEHAACGDMERDPFPSVLRAEALKRGYRSSASFPSRLTAASWAPSPSIRAGLVFLTRRKCCCLMSWPWISALPWRWGKRGPAPPGSAGAPLAHRLL